MPIAKWKSFMCSDVAREMVHFFYLTTCQIPSHCLILSNRLYFSLTSPDLYPVDYEVKAVLQQHLYCTRIRDIDMWSSARHITLQSGHHRGVFVCVLVSMKMEDILRTRWEPTKTWLSVLVVKLFNECKRVLEIHVSKVNFLNSNISETVWHILLKFVKFACWVMGTIVANA